MSSTARTSGSRRPPTRLQRRAPALTISPGPASSWNVAIPLLSPLAASPTSSTVELSAPWQGAPEKKTEEAAAAVEKKHPPVFKKWQHPAAPFCYEPAPFVPSFVPV